MRPIAAHVAALGFKPVTLILLLLLAAGANVQRHQLPVLAGLCASLLGDALTLLPRQRVMYAVGPFSCRICCTRSGLPAR